ncbi:MAG: pyrimidine deaminase RibD-like protein [Myxococcota bacterium]|jgi:pyrimidine deaminase RibD-like protein
MTDHEWMHQALRAARAVRGSTTPNPAVGAVVVRDNRILGIGSTRPIGGAHAEVEALAATVRAGHDPTGAIMYVTLEPCCHWGRTPPCTAAVIDAKIGRVVVGTLDPFPAVQGKGLQALQAAGIDVSLGVHETACARQIRGFARATLHGLPEVGLLGAEGPPAQPSTWDAVVVDPGREAAHGEARRLVLFDPVGTYPADGPLWSDPRLKLVLRTDDSTDPRVERLPRWPDGVAVESALRAMVRAGLHRVLFDVAPTHAAAVIDAGFVDERLTAPRGSSPPS